jgi:HEAT repeat protein
VDNALVSLVARSLLVTFAFSVLLLVFIISRRLVIQSRDSRFEARYLRIEEEVLHAISADDVQPAVEVALKNRSQRKVLTHVLIDFLEIISGRGQEVLRVIFEHGLKERCLKDLRSRFLVRRLRATRLVGLFSVLPDKSLLMDLLKDKPIIRLAAVNAMVQFPDKESLAMVFRAFEQESCPNVHTYTNIIFGAGEKVEPFVKACLKKAAPVEKLSLLIELAGSIPLPSLYPEVVEYADHPEKEVRIKVAKALGKFLVPDSYETLEKMAGDREWEVQAQALKALGRLKNPGALVLLTRGLYSPVWYVRYNAREGLLSVGPLGIRRLEDISRQEVDRFASDMATMALEEISYAGVWS